MPDNFLDFLWPEKPDGYLSTWMKMSGAIRFFHTSQFAEAHRYMSDMAKHDDVYYTVGLLAHPAVKGRGTAKDVSHLPAVHADFDLLGDHNVHAKSALPRSIDELKSFFVNAHIPVPTSMVNSGNGVHAYWRFKNPLTISDDASRMRTATVLKDFQKSIIKLAKDQRGWEFDNTSDLARVLRYPGTKNHKTNPPKNVEIM